jgi:hypothetical protein
MVPAMADDLEFPSCENCAAIGLYVAPMLRAMEAEIGVEETRAFLLAHGGRDYAIAARPPAQLPAALRPADAWLRAAKGPGRITLPLGPVARRARIAWTLYRVLAQGASLSGAAARCGCSLRTATGWRARLTRDGLLAPAPAARTP